MLQDPVAGVAALVEAMWAHESKSGFASPALDKTIRTQKELLLSILELLFDLGLEDCKRHMWEHVVMVENAARGGKRKNL